MLRPDWHTYFIHIAKEVSTRSTCKRAAVGAVVVKDNIVLATGYNGAPAGKPHCVDEGCIIKDGHCTRVVHAEVNAIKHAQKNKISLEGATLYYWDSKGRYAQTMDAFAALFPKQAKAVKKAGITTVIGRGL